MTSMASSISSSRAGALSIMQRTSSETFQNKGSNNNSVGSGSNKFYYNNHYNKQDDQVSILTEEEISYHKMTNRVSYLFGGDDDYESESESQQQYRQKPLPSKKISQIAQLQKKGGRETKMKDLYGSNATPPVTEISINEPTKMRSNRVKKRSSIAPHIATKVMFKDVEVREYERIIGDNPSCSNGPPISIGWHYKVSEMNLTVDDFELQKLSRNRPPHCMVMSRATREEILLQLGYQSIEIADAIRQAIKTKNMRRQTVNNLQWASTEEKMEKVGRKFKKILSFKKKQQ